MAIHDGSRVTLDYVLSVDGEVVESSEDRAPLQYTHGQGQIIPGLEKQLEGMEEGMERIIVVNPEDAYGMPDPFAVEEVPRASLPEDTEPQIGMRMQAKGPDGRVFTVIITDVKENTVIIDFNHPLAGKILHFQVRIVTVQE
ncbi:MAG: peptidylprolyl isomerase [Candidatus Omnitrophica bacterium]|nr:peptidylprolyl isomerase [Candidatus Omnitrophota bacterium]